MTEAEAMAVLKRDLQIQKDNGALPDGIEAVELAINALEKQIAEKQKSTSRCDTCTHYVADEVPPICYMCSKGIEDNYKKGE